MNAIVRLEDTIKFIDCPLLILHGDADPISDIKSSEDLFDTVKSSDKEIKVVHYFFISSNFLSNKYFKKKRQYNIIFRGIFSIFQFMFFKYII